MLSIIVITYNHEKYIRKTLESILDQKMDFEWELIIANDASPDNTHKEIETLISDHPKKEHITYYNHEQNLGMMPNFRFALSKASYPYIAICEGDDFWLDPQKLAKQIRFLKDHKTVDFLFTGGYIYDEHLQKTTSKYWSDELYQEGIIDKDLVLKNGAGSFITSTLIVSQQVIQSYIKEQHIMTDVFLMLHAYRFGDFAYLKDCTACYRINSVEAWSSKGRKDFAFLERETTAIIEDELTYARKFGMQDNAAFKAFLASQYYILIDQFYKHHSSIKRRAGRWLQYAQYFDWKTNVRLFIRMFK